MWSWSKSLGELEMCPKMKASIITSTLGLPKHGDQVIDTGKLLSTHLKVNTCLSPKLKVKQIVKCFPESVSKIPTLSILPSEARNYQGVCPCYTYPLDNQKLQTPELSIQHPALSLNSWVTRSLNHIYSIFREPHFKKMLSDSFRVLQKKCSLSPMSLTYPIWDWHKSFDRF